MHFTNVLCGIDSNVLYNFSKCLQGGEDVFLHASEFEGDELELRDGDTVTKISKLLRMRIYIEIKFENKS